MSRNNKNNHYHYAEKFESRSYRRKNREAKVFVPVKVLVFALLVLLLFGLVSTTFSTYIENNDITAPEGSLLVQVRSVKSSRDIAVTGANNDLASTGGSVTFYCAIYPSTVSGKSLRINYKTGSNNNDGWNMPALTSTGNYYQGREIYSATFTTPYGGAYTYQVQLMNSNNTVSATHELWATDWRSDSNFSGKIHIWDVSTYNYSSYSDITLGWGGGDYYIYNNVAGCWYGNGSTKPAPKMSVGSDSTKRYYDFYLKKDEPGSDGLEFRFWSASLTKELAPSVNQTTLPTDNVVSFDANGTGNKTWKVATDGFTADHFYRVHIEFDVDASNGKGQVTCTSTDLGLLAPTFSLSESTPIARGTTITMRNYGAITNPTNNVGTLSSTYYVKTSGGSYGSAVASNTFSTTGTYVIKHKVTDAGVNASTSDSSTQNAVTARVEEIEKTYEVTVDVPVSAGTGGSVDKAFVSVNQNNSSKQQVEATPADGYVFSSWTASGNARLSPNGTNWYTSVDTTYNNCNPIYVKLNASQSAANNSNGVTANFSEIMHSVTVDNNINSDTTTVSNVVGIATTATTTAATIDNCTFDHWTYTLADTTKSFTLRNNTTLNDSTITYNATSDVTLTAHYSVNVPTAFTITVTGFSAGDGQSAATAYQIPVGEQNFVIGASVNSPAEGVTYIWSTDGTNWTDGTSNDYSSGSLPTTTSQSATEYVIYCKAVINNVESQAIQGSVFYLITAKYLRIDEFNFDSRRDPVQKVYSSAQRSSIDIIADYYAGATHFTTTLKASSDNENFTDYVARTNGALVTAFMECFQNHILPLMDSDGIKFYKIHVEDVENVTNGVQDVTPADSDVIHTTVGTKMNAASKSVYLCNNTGLDLSTSRLMAFYTVEGDIYYQTAQAVSGKTNTYRFTLPTDAEYLSFAVAVADKYKLPVFSTDEFNYNSNNDATTFFTARTATYPVNFNSPYYSTNSAASPAGADGLVIIDGSFAAMP